MATLAQTKKSAMDQSKSNEHRMTRYSGMPVKYQGAEFFTAICKDCGKGIRVYLNGTVTGDAPKEQCL